MLIIYTTMCITFIIIIWIIFMYLDINNRYIKMCSKFICIFALISLSLSLKINIVDEDFIEVLVGNPPVPMKLLIDPVAPFSYMLKKFESSTLLPFENYKFSNSFGTFEGKWNSDFFYLTADKIFLWYVKEGIVKLI